MWKGNNINVSRAGRRATGRHLWARVSSTHSYTHVLTDLHSCIKLPMVTALAAHPETIIMHKFS